MRGLEKEEVKYCALLVRMSTFVKNKVSCKNAESILIGLGLVMSLILFRTHINALAIQCIIGHVYKTDLNLNV